MSNCKIRMSNSHRRLKRDADNLIIKAMMKYEQDCYKDDTDRLVSLASMMDILLNDIESVLKCRDQHVTNFRQLQGRLR